MDEDGEYVQIGDAFEWKWAEGKEPQSFGGVEPDFDPTSAPPLAPSPAEGEVVLQVPPVEEEVDLETLTKAELQQMALDAGMDSSGSKAELIERLAD